MRHHQIDSHVRTTPLTPSCSLTLAPDDPTGTFSGPASHTKCDMQIRPKIGCQTVSTWMLGPSHSTTLRSRVHHSRVHHSATADAQNPIRHGTYAGCQTLAACLPLLPPSSPSLPCSPPSPPPQKAGQELRSLYLGHSSHDNQIGSRARNTPPTRSCSPTLHPTTQPGLPMPDIPTSNVKCDSPITAGSTFIPQQPQFQSSGSSWFPQSADLLPFAHTAFY